MKIFLMKIRPRTGIDCVGITVGCSTEFREKHKTDGFWLWNVYSFWYDIFSNNRNMKLSKIWKYHYYDPGNNNMRYST